MSLLERAFSFLKCTCCGKFFGYNEKVLSCENRRNRNCFDHEAVCGKCMHDHAESIHVMDKQRYITEFVARRHDIEEKIRDFTNKMETKFFDGSIGSLIDQAIVMAEVEASKTGSADFAEVAERRKAELLQLRSDFNGCFEPKVAQPKSLSGTSVVKLKTLMGSVAVESVPEKEVVAEEPKKLDFPGIDLKLQEEEEKQQQMQAYQSARLQPDKTAQSTSSLNPIPPGDIFTQPNKKVVFNAPYDDKHTYHIKVINASGRRIGWAFKTSNMKRLGVDPPCGVLNPKEGVLVAVSCDAFAFGQENTNNDRIIIEWTNTPDGATKQFRREWFQGDGLVRRKNLPIEYNP